MQFKLLYCTMLKSNKVKKLMFQWFDLPHLERERERETERESDLKNP